MAFHADWLPSPTPQFRSSFEKQQLAFAVETSAGKPPRRAGRGWSSSQTPLPRAGLYPTRPGAPWKTPLARLRPPRSRRRWAPSRVRTGTGAGSRPSARAPGAFPAWAPAPPAPRVHRANGRPPGRPGSPRPASSLPQVPGEERFKLQLRRRCLCSSLLSAMRIFASRGLKLCCWVPTASEGAGVWRRPCTPRRTTEVQAPDEASSAAPFCRELARHPALPWDLGPPSAQRGESNGGGAALPQKTVVGEKVASISYGPATT